jgi:hypothetical protein
LRDHRRVKGFHVERRQQNVEGRARHCLLLRWQWPWSAVEVKCSTKGIAYLVDVFIITISIATVVDVATPATTPDLLKKRIRISRRSA